MLGLTPVVEGGGGPGPAAEEGHQPLPEAAVEAAVDDGVDGAVGVRNEVRSVLDGLEPRPVLVIVLSKMRVRT